MVVPIEDKGDAILIVTRNAGGAALMGFVAASTLGELLEQPLSACECMAVVERHLRSFEHVLLRKSIQQAYVEQSIACVEIETGDLTGTTVAELRRT
jgi:hypothetical protein